MGIRKGLTASMLLLWCLMEAAKDKKKLLFPADVLEAHTVLVIVDPNAGIVVEHPNANRMAREDVENALMKWGRYSLVSEPWNADLIITVKKGSGKVAQPTIGGVPMNNDPVVMEPGDSGGRIGGDRGIREFRATLRTVNLWAHAPKWRPGSQQDMFVVYRGTRKIRPDPRSTLPQCGAIARPTRLSPRRFRRSLCSAT